MPNGFNTPEVFWSRTLRLDSGCVVWTGVRHSHGYGLAGRNGKRNVYAHRLSWSLANGRPVPEGLQVCHHCDNPPCVNPEHLFLGTAKDNVQDAIRKGRREIYPQPRPRRYDYDLMFKLKASGMPLKQIAAVVGCPLGTVAGTIYKKGTVQRHHERQSADSVRVSEGRKSNGSGNGQHSC